MLLSESHDLECAFFQVLEDGSTPILSVSDQDPAGLFTVKGI